MIEKKWWMQAVGYQIYPRTFYDANQDGVGDLRGIITKLDYLNELGIDLIWIGPFYRSPMDDNGYDVSDFYDVDPMFGSLDDAKELIEKAHAKGIRIILDLVLNHTSDEHPWFMEARSSVDNPKRDYYIWQKGKEVEGKLLPPTNWGSFFEGSAWNYDAKTDEFYMKIFSNKMPDLNWANPELREEMFKVARWWLDQGVDGFRVDAIAHLARDLSFTDSELPLNDHGVAPDWAKFSNREELFDYIHEFNEKVLSHYDCMSVGEVGGGAKIEAGVRYAGYDAQAFNMVFNFDHCWSKGGMDILNDDDKMIVDVVQLKENMAYWINGMKDKGWLPHYWLNHDHPRVISQYGDPEHNHRLSGMMLGTILLTLPGTPFIYNGEEIGMTNVDYESIDDFKDVWVKNNAPALLKKYPLELVLRHLRRTSRDNARTPMQWTDEVYAGFSTVEPIQKINRNRSWLNVEAQEKDEQSILNHYRRLIHLRKNLEYLETLVFGDFALLDPKNPDVYAYTRTSSQKKITVIANFRPTTIKFEHQAKAVCLSNYLDTKLNITELRPYEAIVFEE